jgi:hypothetical protein
VTFCKSLSSSLCISLACGSRGEPGVHGNKNWSLLRLRENPTLEGNGDPPFGLLECVPTI